MYQIHTCSQFRKDLDLAKDRDLDMGRFKTVVTALAQGKTLPAANKTHHLVGKWKSYVECHIAPDWVLIFRYKGKVLKLARTGTHSDLF